MKRAASIHHLSKNGCKLIRECGRHSIWKNKYSGEMTTVPRHNDKEFMARKICKDLGIVEA
uniref:HicA toxin of toxin-antitoxin n=1 Tax=Candidatus Kentrum sp. TC TaxID=2126339 RepID=A0A450Z5Y2_9GAMM|nr:MAG: HicA toxin of toxin-antitoxin [Candidatus Kentron sp. TC]